MSNLFETATKQSLLSTKENNENHLQIQSRPRIRPKHQATYTSNTCNLHFISTDAILRQRVALSAVGSTHCEGLR